MRAGNAVEGIIKEQIIDTLIAKVNIISLAKLIFFFSLHKVFLIVSR